MSTYVALLDGGGREETIEVRSRGVGMYEVALGGKVFQIDAFRHDFGTLSFLVDSASYSVMLDHGATEVKVQIRGSTYPLEILDERRLRMRRASGKFTVEGRQTIVAPMPGRVVKLLVRAGEKVTEGQGILVIEAMKMENELKAPRDGVLVELSVVEGQAVESGAKLAAVE